MTCQGARLVVGKRRTLPAFSKAGAFLRRDFLFETSYRLQSLFRLTSVFVQVLVFYFLSKMIGANGGAGRHLEAYGNDYFTFALVGISFTGMFNAGLLNFTSLIRQQLSVGVLEAMAATPIRSGSLLSYSLLFPMGYEILKGALYLTLGYFLLGAQIGIVNAPMLAVTLCLALAVFGSLGVIAASLIVYVKSGDPIAWFLSATSSLLGGILFPVSVLPAGLQLVGQALPITYAVDAVRACLIPAAHGVDLGRNLALLSGFAVFLIPAAFGFSSLMFEAARRQGSLGQY